MLTIRRGIPVRPVPERDVYPTEEKQQLYTKTGRVCRGPSVWVVCMGRGYLSSGRRVSAEYCDREGRTDPEDRFGRALGRRAVLGEDDKRELCVQAQEGLGEPRGHGVGAIGGCLSEL